MLNNLFKCTGSKIKVLFIKVLIEQVQEQRNFIWSLKRLEECVWRNASKETSLKKSSWRHVIRSKVIRSNGHQKHLTRSYFTRVDIVRCTKCTTTNSATTIFATLSLHQDKDNSNIAAGRHCFFSNGMDLKLVLHRTNIKSGKRSMVKNQSFKQDKLM